MAGKPGYVKYNGETRYTDGKGNFYYNHLGPALNQIGNLFNNPGFGRTTSQHIIGEDGRIGGRIKEAEVAGTLPADDKGNKIVVTGKDGVARTYDLNYEPHRKLLQQLEGKDSVAPKPPKPRVPDREEGNGVTTSPTGKSSAASPTDWKKREDDLNSRGIYLQVDRARGIGNHPTYEQAVKDAGEYDYGSDAGYGGYETYTGSPDKTQYTATGQSTALGAQTGTSSDADVGDQSRALRIPKGARQQEVFFRQNPNYGQETKTAEPPASAISVRSRAFLDAPMGVGPKGIMDHTNAAQNMIEGKRGEYLIKTGEGEYTPITQEGYDEIRQNLRNATEFKEEFMRNYVPESPAETQSLHSGAPVPASKMEYNTNFGPTVDTETYGKIVDSTKGMTGIGPIADSEVYGMFLDGREPLMRGPKKDEE